MFLANHWLYADLQDLLMGVLHALTATIDAKDPYTCGHSQRVAFLSRLIADKAGVEPARAGSITSRACSTTSARSACRRRSCGRKERLTPEEYVLMKQHPTLRHKILQDIHQARTASSRESSRTTNGRTGAATRWAWRASGCRWAV